jgi:hypothetical protein
LFVRIKSFLVLSHAKSLRRREQHVAEPLMQSVNLTDEQLWRAIAQNTNAMTALIHQQLELDPAVNTPNGIIRQAKLRESNAERIGKLERNYREYATELRRRYSLE